MGSVRRRAVPALRPYVLGYTGFHTAFPEPRRRLELPNGTFTLVLSFADGLHVTGTDGLLRPAPAAMISGLHTGPVTGVHRGEVHGLEVNLTPTGAYRLLGLPMRYFRDVYLDLADVLGPCWPRLTDRLRELPGWEARFALLDQALAALFEAGRQQLSPEVGHALSLLRGAGPSLAEATAETGWSARNLRARFQEEVGLSPKGVARVYRLQRALLALSGGTPAAGTAALCGYHDQAHLSRDIKAMTGLSPSALLRLRAGALPGSPLDRLPGRITSVLLPGRPTPAGPAGERRADGTAVPPAADGCLGQQKLQVPLS
ncbi:helix-turn-helix domain-containing protein [Streptomyces sp. Qhu-G9]|uniref:AraC family transcriptional regulator n=1 Tax=Streptomyces sp. Qhu-G9 TaxID=3452799 RepID=UPI0022AC39CC|nr:helix-turn-helix domain-containing protein [Streptomyces aurantiacus]WAU82555.1 helix-turn-helix domain-containing protein [Streptomyces aurantiacus]